jgi:hypothetical protein
VFFSIRVYNYSAETAFVFSIADIILATKSIIQNPQNPNVTMKKVLFGLLSLALITTTACKKSKDAPAFTKENVAGTYKLDKVTFKYGSSEQDITSAWVDDCEKDDILELKVDLTFTSTDAGVECTGDYSGTWSIPAANKFEMDGETYDVATWDGNYAGFSQVYDFGGQNGTIIMYIKRQ